MLQTLKQLQSFVLHLRRVRGLPGALALIILFCGVGFSVCNTANPTARFDFDNDCIADAAVYRAPGKWWLNYSFGVGPSTYCGTAATCVMTLGVANDKIVPADYDGDGKTDVAVYSPGNGNWTIIPTSTGVSVTQNFWSGNSDDIPQPYDYNADGKDDLAYFRPAAPLPGQWQVANFMGSVIITLTWGVAGDRPVVGDYDSDGKADFAVVHTTTAGMSEWQILKTASPIEITLFGLPSDALVPADYDGDKLTDLAVYRQGSPSQWWIRNSSNFTIITLSWGNSLLNDIPIPADYNSLPGDVLENVAIYRPMGAGNSPWWVSPIPPFPAPNANWGIAGDEPIPHAYVK